jgi:hypothetical protein
MTRQSVDRQMTRASRTGGDVSPSTRCHRQRAFIPDSDFEFDDFLMPMRRAKETVADGTRNLLGQRGAAHRRHHRPRHPHPPQVGSGLLLTLNRNPRRSTGRLAAACKGF